MEALVRRIFTGVVVVMMLTGGAVQEPFQEALHARAKGDYASALRLWRPLAEQGHDASQFQLAIMYEQGRGVPQDYAEALVWYRLAADQGHTQAQFNLGLLYFEGKGVQPDLVQAHKWINLAVSQAPNKLHDAFASARDSVASHMRPDQIIEAQKLAREWKPK